MNDRFDDASDSPSPPARPRRRVLGRLRPLAQMGTSDEAPCFDSEPSASGPTAEGGTEGAASRLRRVLPDIYFVNTPAERAERHGEMIERLRSERGRTAGNPILDFHGERGRPLVECTLCAFDEAAPGLLAKVCGTVAALDLSIHTAFIYTLRLDERPSEASEAALAPASDLAAGRAVALNTFLMSESYFGHDRALTPKTQKKLAAELCRVLRGEVKVADLLTSSRRAPERVNVHELLVENRPHDEHTRILLRAGDSFGVLYHATSAIAALGLSVVAAQVSTREAEADDLFFVAGPDGARLPDADLQPTQSRLRALLQNEA